MENFFSTRRRGAIAKAIITERKENTKCEGEKNSYQHGNKIGRNSFAQFICLTHFGMRSEGGRLSVSG
jgi:hypothetical protein